MKNSVKLLLLCLVLTSCFEKHTDVDAVPAATLGKYLSGAKVASGAKYSASVQALLNEKDALTEMDSVKQFNAAMSNPQHTGQVLWLAPEGLASDLGMAAFIETYPGLVSHLNVAQLSMDAKKMGFSDADVAKLLSRVITESKEITENPTALLVVRAPISKEMEQVLLDSKKRVLFVASDLAQLPVISGNVQVIRHANVNIDTLYAGLLILAKMLDEQYKHLGVTISKEAVIAVARLTRAYYPTSPDQLAVAQGIMESLFQQHKHSVKHNDAISRENVIEKFSEQLKLPATVVISVADVSGKEIEAGLKKNPRAFADAHSRNQIAAVVKEALEEDFDALHYRHDNADEMFGDVRNLLAEMTGTGTTAVSIADALGALHKEHETLEKEINAQFHQAMATAGQIRFSGSSLASLLADVHATTGKNVIKASEIQQKVTTLNANLQTIDNELLNDVVPKVQLLGTTVSDIHRSADLVATALTDPNVGLSQKVGSLGVTVNGLITSMQTTMSGLNNAVGNAITDMNTQQRSLLRHLADAKTALDGMVQGSADARQAAIGLQTDLPAINTQLDQLKTNLIAMKRVADDINEAESTLSTAVNQARTTAQNRATSFASTENALAAELTEYGTKLVALRGQIAALSTQITQTTAALSTLQQERDVLQRTVHTLQQQPQPGPGPQQQRP